ncbi:type IV pilus twitching motility protein PilT [bacterium]|nr:type IV pilus twitching motility protein PilT [bacterium]
MITLRELLEEIVTRNASDLHLTVGVPPVFRIDGELVHSQHEILRPADTQRLAFSVLTENQKKKFEEARELDLSFGIEKLSRFRGNVFLQRGCVAMAIRQIPFAIPSFEELGLPKVIADLALKPRGLVLVTGPTGSGKSTTQAAMLDRINRHRSVHVVTVEDPIEFLHQHNRSIINQREVYEDTDSFSNALKYVLREDPDVVLIGEMRDLETMETTLRIAETGHLALATLHTNSCDQSITRIVDSFPAHQQSQVRTQLSFVMEGIISQQLLPKIGGGRVMALEILICTPAIRALIRDQKAHQIYSLIQAGTKYGMRTMNQSLMELCQSGEVAMNDALQCSSRPDELEEMLSAGGPESQGKSIQPWRTAARGR